MNNKNKLGFAGKMASVFVNNGRLSILMILTIFAWGAISFAMSPKQYNPEIVAPAFNVVTEFPGASNLEVLKLVTKPLEDKINDIKGVDEISSQSIDGGVSIVTVKFFVGEDMERSKIKLLQKISGNMDLKPMGVSGSIVQDINLDDVPVLVLALSSDELSPIILRKLVYDVKDEVKNIKNVTNVEVLGEKKRQLKIKLNSQELNNQNISILNIVDVLKRNNLRIDSGKIETVSEKILVNIDGNIENVDDLKRIVLRVEGEQVVYLSDVAEIVSEAEDDNSFAKYQDHNSSEEQNTVYLSIAKKKGSNIGKVTGSVLDEVDELKKTIIPGNVVVNVVRDEGQVANEEIFGLAMNLAQAIAIVFVVLLIFLGARAATIVAVAIPLVLASVFGAGLLADQSVNRITLFALILSLGLLVDSATVVVENAVRHVSRGDDLKRSIINSVDEVGMGLFMSTITTLLAFFPMAFISGMMGPYMGPIPFFVPAALVFSLLIAYTINPYLASVLIKPDSIDEVKKESAFKIKLEKKYKNLLSKLFANKKYRNKVLIATLALFMLVMMLPVFGIVKFRMLPKADREQFYVYLDYPENILVKENNRITSKVEDLLLANENIVSVQSFVGEAPIIDFNGLFKGFGGRSGDNNATIKVNLTHHDKRKVKSEDIVLELRPQINNLIESEGNIKAKLIEDPPGPPVLSTVLIKIKGNDYKRLKDISRDLELILNETDEVFDVDSTRGEKTQNISLRIDYDKALRSGVDVASAAYALRIALHGENISVVHSDTNPEQEYVYMQLDKEFRDSVSDLEAVFISNNKGEKVPLLEIVKKETGVLADVIYQDNREKTVYLSAEMGDRSVTYATIDLYKKLLKYKLDTGSGVVDGFDFFGFDFVDKENGEKIKVEWGGEWKLTVEVFRDLGLAMMIAVFLIYVVLVAQFHSFKTPMLIMMTILLAMIGVMPGFAVLGATLGIYFNATSMIGVIALAGIVVNNAIILVEYLNGLKSKNMSIEEALIEAGTTRMRPIVLTSLTTILGSLAIIGDPVWAGLAWAIVFGISISTVLTLVIFPVLYFVFEGPSYAKASEGRFRDKI